MKKILCFGDSNTFGYIPANGGRYSKNIRWTGILQDLCKNDFEIIEAGCNNRTCFVDNPNGIMLTGYKILPEILQSDLDIVILALGINDLQLFFNVSENDIKNGIENLIDIVRSKVPNAQIIILSPARLSNDVLHGGFAFQFDRTSIEKSLVIGKIYQTVAQEKLCDFLDLDKIVKVSQKDGLHFEPEQHKIIAQAIFEDFINPSNVTRC
jgi:lysophospholipase L1-like esterase